MVLVEVFVVVEAPLVAIEVIVVLMMQLMLEDQLVVILGPESLMVFVEFVVGVVLLQGSSAGELTCVVQWCA